MCIHSGGLLLGRISHIFFSYYSCLSHFLQILSTATAKEPAPNIQSSSVLFSRALIDFAGPVWDLLLPAATISVSHGKDRRTPPGFHRTFLVSMSWVSLLCNWASCQPAALTVSFKEGCNRMYLKGQQKPFINRFLAHILEGCSESVNRRSSYCK